MDRYIGRMSPFVIALFLVPAATAAELVIQPQFTGAADYGSGTGQSFIVPSGSTLRAVQLHIASRGGSIEVRLWKTLRSNGRLSRSGTQPLATGILQKTAVVGNTPGWFEVTLNPPYVAAGNSTEELVFDIELLTSGTNGWNDYSLSQENVFKNGSRVGWSTAGSVYTENATVDLAFKIAGDPPIAPLVPKALLILPAGLSDPGQSISYQLTGTLAHTSYTLRKSENLVSPIAQWFPVSTQTSTGDRLEWLIPYEPAVPKLFFAVTTD